MPRIELDTIAQTNSTNYPAALAGAVAGRFVRRLAPPFGVEDYGISHVVLKPGAASSQRHWHEEEDEFVVMLSGEAVLVEEGSRTAMRPGDLAVFPKAVANGHQLLNESAEDCAFIAISGVPTGRAHYPDVDLHYPGTGGYCHKDGRPW
ncbi:MAG: cupin domain-containing protein [Sphingobium sp.]